MIEFERIGAGKRLLLGRGLKLRYYSGANSAFQENLGQKKDGEKLVIINGYATDK